MSAFTERQAKGWAEAITDIHSRGVEPSDNPDSFYWTLVFAEETRPGRGQDLAAFWNDGEHLVHVRIDVRAEDDEPADDERELVDVVVAGGLL
jgi:hypothetical protein